MSPRTTAFLAPLLLLVVGAGGQFQRDRIDPMVIFHLSYQTIITKSGLFPIGSCYPLGTLHQCLFLSISHLPFRLQSQK